MRKAATSRKVFQSPTLPKLDDNEEWDETDENQMVATPLQIKRDAKGLMKVVATPKLNGANDVLRSNITIDAPVGVESESDEREEPAMTLEMARQFRGVRMALHAKKLEINRMEGKITTLASAKEASEAEYTSMKEKLSERLKRMTDTASNAKDTIRKLERENAQLTAKVASLENGPFYTNFRLSDWISTPVSIAAFCVVASVCAGVAYSR